MLKIAVLCRSLGRRCGIAEYSTLLAERLGAVLVSSVADVPKDTDVVFVQYEPFLYEGSADIIGEVASIRRSAMVVVDAHHISREIVEPLRWQAIVASKRDAHPGTVRLSLCTPVAKPDAAGAHSELRLGTFGFAFPAKRYEMIVDLARRLGIGATILASHNNATPELAEISSTYLENLKVLAGGDIEIISEFLPEEEVLRRLRECSHLISAMDDNLSQSASMRTMAAAGRPLISLNTKQAQEVGAVLVDDLDSITMEFLKNCRELPHVYDGIADYKAFLEQLSSMFDLEESIEHPDEIYLEDPRQMERLDWLRQRIDGRAIDVGIGSGFSTNYIRAVAGAELRPDRLQYASIRFPHIDFRLLDAGVNVVHGFDTVVFGEIVEHMPLAQARQMIDLWAATDPKRILITTPNAGKRDYDEALVHNPEHVWEPTDGLISHLTPSGYLSTVTKSSGEDFLLIELSKVPVGGGQPTPKQRQIEELQSQNDNLRRLAEEREIYAATLAVSQRALDQQVQQLNEQVNTVLPARIGGLQKELTQARAETNKFERDLNAVLESRSWKLTAPLRKAISGVTFLLGRRTPDPSSEIHATAVEHDPRPAASGIGVCTVISKNYLAQARVLVASFKEHHPDIPFYVLLADKLDGYFDPSREQFELLELDELDIPDPDRFRFHYNVLEHDTAVKPYFFSCLLRKRGLKKLVYLDPDIQVLDRLDNLFSLLDEHSIVLVPHTSMPIDDEFEPNELTILKAGTFNLGFLALQNTPSTQDFLKWWEKRLYAGCRHEPENAMNVDQKWIDLVPSFFDGVHILKDAGYNIAYWNLHSRNVTAKGKKAFANGEPIYFFHFSGFNPHDMKRVSKYQNRFTLDDLGRAGEILFENYRKLLLEAGYDQASKWPYSYNTFDNGAKIPEVARKLYMQFGDGAKRFGNPFDTASPTSFFNWLNGSYDGQRSPSRLVTRLWFEIYKSRPDVQRAYPDVFGAHRIPFLQWVSGSGPREHDIDERFIVHKLSLEAARRPHIIRRIARLPRRIAKRMFVLLKPTLKPVLKKTIGRSDRAWHRLQRIRDRLLGGAPPPAGMEAPFAKRLASVLGAGNGRLQTNGTAPPFGVNVAGYLSSEKGTGEAARSAISILQSKGIPVALNNIIDSGSENVEDTHTDFADDNPYAFNLIFVNADQATNFAWHKGEDYFRGRYNIGVWNWELMDFPKEWLNRFQYYDEIWVATNFVLEALSPISPVPVVRIPYALQPDPVRDRNLKRTRFGIPDDHYMFLFMFDFHSVLERKNPLGLIRAFKQAFSNDDPVSLLIKSSHADDQAVRTLKEAAAGASIHVIDTVLTREEVNALYSLSDCYVSLHRSEGFGLTVAEAMLAGKPTIATAYSGNLDFMTPDNSYLVTHSLATIEKDHDPYQKGWVWADPDAEHAAQIMRYVYENPDEAKGVGAKAREDIIRLLHPQTVAELMSQRLKAIASFREITVPAAGEDEEPTPALTTSQ